MPRTVVDSPIGPLGVVASDTALEAVLFDGRSIRPEGRSRVLDEVAHQLDAYFAAELIEFDLPLGLHEASSIAAAGSRSPRFHTARR